MRIYEVGTCQIWGPTLLIRLSADAISIRCIRCRASVIHMSIASVIRRLYLDLSKFPVYEMSSRSPLFDYLKARAGEFSYSEYFDEVEPGATRNGVMCQDVQKLAFPDHRFGLCTSTEVSEHVEDDIQGFREIFRVLQPAGRFVFTVPLSGESKTITRAMLLNGKIRHLLPPEYHGDTIRGSSRVLCYRNYGADILERLLDCGFSDAMFCAHAGHRGWGP